MSLRNVEDLLFERGIDICHETVRLWWDRFSTVKVPVKPFFRAKFDHARADKPCKISVNLVR